MDMGDGLLRELIGDEGLFFSPRTPNAVVVATATRATAAKALQVGEEELFLCSFADDDTVAVADVLIGDAGRFSRIVTTSASLKSFGNNCVRAAI